MIALCPSAELIDGGRGVRFQATIDGESTPAFVVRYRGRAVGYLNRCAHVAMELDWLAGSFFDDEARYLICATHGALYEPADGRCVGGPCAGRGGLAAVPVVEHDGFVWSLPATSG